MTAARLPLREHAGHASSAAGLAAVGLGAAIGVVVALMGNAFLVPLLLLTALVGLAVLVRPELAVPMAIGLIYSNAAVVAAQLHGAPYLLAAAVPGLLLLPVIQQVVMRRQPLVGLPLIALLVAYLGVLLLSALTSRNPAMGSEEVGRFVGEGLVLYVLVLQAIRGSRLLWAVIGVLLAVGGVLGMLSLIQQVTGTFDQNYFGFSQADGRGFAFAGAAGEEVQRRVAGPIGEKNRYGQVMLALVPLAIVAIRRAPSLALKAVLAILLLLISAGVVLTFSRGAAVGAVALIAGLVALGLIGRRGLLVAGGAMAALLLAVPAWAGRLATLEGLTDAADAGDRVIAQRLNDVLAAFLAFLENPVLGVGPAQFSTVYREYAVRVPGLPGDRDFEAHTLYGDVAAETGLLGLITFFGLVALTTVLLVRARRLAISRGRKDLGELASAFLLVVVVHLSTGLFLHLSYQRYYWLAMALAAVAALVVTAEARRSPGTIAPAPVRTTRTGRVRRRAARAVAGPRAGRPAT
jgi:putative inorganic carbon (hco3(-)) transporter